MVEKILLIDDEESILLSCRKNFEHEGYDVTTASSGEEGIAYLRNNLFHLVVSDLVMGGIDGIGVLEAAREKYQNIGTIILTGYGDLDSAIKALRLGVDDYLLKPCHPEELFIRARRCLEKRRAFQLNELYEKILPVCMYCKNIRDDSGGEFGRGKWFALEEYLERKSGVEFSRTCCPDCGEVYKNSWMKY